MAILYYIRVTEITNFKSFRSLTEEGYRERRVMHQKAVGYGVGNWRKAVELSRRVTSPTRLQNGA